MKHTRIAIATAAVALTLSAPSQAIGMSSCQQARTYAAYEQGIANTVCFFTSGQACVDARWNAITASWYADEVCGAVYSNELD